MDLIDIPLLSIDTPLAVVRKTMKAIGRSAVMAQDDHGLWLFLSPYVSLGLLAGKISLADIGEPQRRPVHVLSPGVAAVAGLNFHQPHSTYSQFENYLDVVGRTYAALAPDSLVAGNDLLSAPALAALNFSTGKMVQIVTRREKDRRNDIDRGPGDYVCSNTNIEPPHEFPPLQREPNGECPICHVAVVQAPG